MRHRRLSLRLHLISAETDRKEGGIVAESPVSERQRIFDLGVGQLPGSQAMVSSEAKARKCAANQKAVSLRKNTPWALSPARTIP
jgi:hypothetical protein